MSRILFFFLAGTMLLSCKSDYDKLVRSQLDSGVIHEELIFDMKMGDTKKEFYAICWELNNQQKVSQGPYNQMVKYIIEPEEIPGETEKIEMLFYGNFDGEDVLRGMNFRFAYINWAPWNEELHAEKLIEKLQQYFVDMYGGNEFIEVDLGLKDIKSYVKVDGNRQIVIYPQTTKDVIAKVEDLRYRLTKKEKDEV